MLEPVTDQRPTLFPSIFEELMVELAIFAEVIEALVIELRVTAFAAILSLVIAPALILSLVTALAAILSLVKALAAILSLVTAPVASMEAVTPPLVTVSATFERKAKAPATSCCRGEISVVKLPPDAATLTPRYRLLLLIFERMVARAVLFDGPLTPEMACPFPMRTLNSPPEIVVVCCSP